MAVIDLAGVRRLHPDGSVALDGIDLHVPDGAIVGVLGPSGSGKSALLRVVAGLDRPTAGSVALDGRDVGDLEPRARNVALVTQQRILRSFLTVAEELAFPLEMRHLEREEVERRTAAERRAFRLQDLWRRPLGTLSAGDAQRTALAAAMVRLPDVLLLDEPLQRLDPPSRRSLRDELMRLHRARPTTTLHATNDHAQVQGMADLLLVLRHGRIAQLGAAVEVLSRPADRWLAGFVGPTPMTFIDAIVVDDAGLGWLQIGDQRLRVPGGLPGPLRARAGGPVVLGARPDAVRSTQVEDPVDQRLSGVVLDRQRLGHQDDVTVGLPTGRWGATFPAGSGVRPGQTVEVTVTVRRLSAFDPEDGTAVWHGG